MQLKPLGKRKSEDKGPKKQKGLAYSRNQRRVSVTSVLWIRTRKTWTEAKWAEVRSRMLNFILRSMGRYLKGSVILKGHIVNFPVVSSTSMKCMNSLICGFLKGICNFFHCPLRPLYDEFAEQKLYDILNQFSLYPIFDLVS